MASLAGMWVSCPGGVYIDKRGEICSEFFGEWVSWYLA